MGNPDSGVQITKRKTVQKNRRKNQNESEGRSNKSYTHIKHGGNIQKTRVHRVFLIVVGSIEK